MKTLFILAAAFALFVGSAARAGPYFSPESNELFWNACSGADLGPLPCQEYISGTLDTLYYMEALGHPSPVARFCIPDYTSFGQVVDEVTTQMRAHPNLRNETDTPTLLIGAILEHRWPCNHT